MMSFIQFQRSSEIIKFDSPKINLTGNAFLPSIAFIPLLQDQGIESNPIVSPGEKIQEGQLIARGNGTTSANIHASIPGILKEYRTVPLPNGRNGKAAVIELAGSFDILGRKEENFSWVTAPESEILRVLEDKGVINTFEYPVPLAFQLRESKKNGSSVIALRFFDADPTCQIDSFLSQNFLQTVLEGTALLAKSIEAVKVYLVYNEKEWFGPSISDLTELFQKRKVILIKGGKKYPSGNSKQFCHLINEKTPVLIDPVTAFSSFEAIVRNQPMLHRFISITGPAIDSPSILKVKIGTPIGDIIEECGGFRTDPARIVVNGLLEGHAVYDLDSPITKYTKSLHIMDTDTCPSYKVRDCIHCGRCLQVCPISIDPMRVVTFIKKNKETPALLSSINSCQYCGCCAIVCPSRIPLHHIIKEASERLNGEIQ